MTTKRTGHLAVFFANIIFGLNTPIARTLIPNELDPFAVTFFRMAGAALLFWGASLFVKKEIMPIKDKLMLFFASFFGLVMNQMSFLYGLSITSPIDASLVITLLPILTMLLAALILKEPITWLKSIGVIVGACGAVLLILNSASHHQKGSIFGNLIILSSSFSFALYLTLFKNLISKYPAVHIMKWMFLYGTFLTLPFCFQAVKTVDYSALSLSAYLRLMYVVIFATFVAYMLIQIGQKALRPTTLSMYNYMQPIIASLVTIALGMDVLSYEHLLSAVLVFAGVYIVTQSKSRAQVEAEKSSK